MGVVMTCLRDCLADDPSVFVVVAASSLLVGWANSFSHFGENILGTDFCSVMNEEDDVVFYDWLTDNSGDPVGLDLGANTPADISKDLLGRPYFTNDLFPRIMLRTTGSSIIPLGLEAFGDINLLRSSSGIWAISVPPASWLNASQMEGLSRLVALYQPKKS